MISSVHDPVADGLRTMRKTLGEYAVGMGILAAFLFPISGICRSGCGAGATWFSAIALVAVTLLSGRAALNLLRRDSNSLWTPAVIYPVGTALFFGVGPMVVLFGTDATKALVSVGRYQITPEGLILTIFLTTIGVTFCLLGLVAGLYSSGIKKDHHLTPEPLSLSAIALTFFISGAVLKYGFVLPSEWGITEVVVPGALTNLGHMIDLSFAIMTFLALRKNKKWLLVFLLVWPVHIGISILTFEKREVMFAILLPAAGAYLAHRNWRRMVPWIVAAALAFTILQDVNTTARKVIKDRTGNISEADFVERVVLIQRIVSGEYQLAQVSTAQLAEAQLWWMRLDYSGAQLRAYQLYNQGIEGEWYQSLSEIFVPRFLWSDKPIKINPGRVFNRIVAANPEAQSNVGISIYADGYWQSGWFGTLLFSFIYGVILGGITRILYPKVVKRDLVYLPVIFLGMLTAGTGATKYLEKIVGIMPIFFGYLFLIFLLQWIIQSGRGYPQPGPGRSQHPLWSPAPP